MSVHTQMLRGLAALPLLFLACLAGVTAPAPGARCERLRVVAPARVVALADVAMPAPPERRVVVVATTRAPRAAAR